MQDPSIILTYFDCTVRKNDAKLFLNGNWLNDTCITFYYEYLKN